MLSKISSSQHLKIIISDKLVVVEPVRYQNVLQYFAPPPTPCPYFTNFHENKNTSRNHSIYIVRVRRMYLHNSFEEFVACVPKKHYYHYQRQFVSFGSIKRVNNSHKKVNKNSDGMFSPASFFCAKIDPT